MLLHDCLSAFIILCRWYSFPWPAGSLVRLSFRFVWFFSASSFTLNRRIVYSLYDAGRGDLAGCLSRRASEDLDVSFKMNTSILVCGWKNERALYIFDDVPSIPQQFLDTCMPILGNDIVFLH